MEEKEISSFTREDFDRRLRGLEQYLKGQQVKKLDFIPAC